MVLQPRAEATRQKIIDAAVDVFTELGYGEAGLAEVLKRAQVSKGAFYYHFESKEAVAVAIIRQATDTLNDAFAATMESSAPAFENVIRTTFVIADTIDGDKVARLGHQLIQGMGQVSRAGAASLRGQTTAFVGAVKSALAATETRHDVDIADAAETIWVGMLGCHLLAHAAGDDPRTRLGQAWRVLLRSILPPHSVPRFDAFVARTAWHYAHAV